MDTAGPGRRSCASGRPIPRARCASTSTAPSSRSIEAPMSDLLGGKFPGLPRPIAGEYSKGWNLYFPIPYAKTLQGHQRQGRLLLPRELPHLRGRAPRSSRSAATSSKPWRRRSSKLAARLADPRRRHGRRLARRNRFDLELPAGRDRAARSSPGPRRSRASSSSCRRQRTARRRCAGMIVKMTFDGEHCVEAPLGDFFGTAPGINALRLAAAGHDQGGRDVLPLVHAVQGIGGDRAGEPQPGSRHPHRRARACTTTTGPTARCTSTPSGGRSSTCPPAR